LLVRALARGATLVDAAYYALPALSWQCVLIGDPLYRPFAVPLDAQWANLKKLPPRLAGYAALRRMHQLDALNRRDEATAFLRTAQREAPSLAVGLALARRLHEAGDDAGAAGALGFAALLKTYRTDEWALAREAALLFDACARPALAVDAWKNLLSATALPRELREPWLTDAKKSAVAAGNQAQADLWQKEFDLLTAPPPAPEKK
jgi:hypothetical protein